jgi:hypothetical protein
MSISLTVARSHASCSSGCSPASPRAATPHGGAGRQGGRDQDTLDVEVGGVATFVERTRESLVMLMLRDLSDMRLAGMMVDGPDLKGRTNIVALEITTEGVKVPLGPWERSTDNATVATSLLSNLVERGLDPEQGILFVIDCAKALRKAIRSVFGEVPVQRCVRHYADFLVMPIWARQVGRHRGFGLVSSA